MDQLRKDVTLPDDKFQEFLKELLGKGTTHCARRQSMLDLSLVLCLAHLVNESRLVEALATML